MIKHSKALGDFAFSRRNLRCLEVEGLFCCLG